MLKDDNRTELEEYKDRSKSQILSFASSTSWWTQAWNSSVDWLILRFFLHSSRSSRSSLIMSFASSWAYSGSRSTFNLASMTEIIISSVSLILDSSRMAGSWTAIKKLSENVSIVEVNVIYLLNAELYILKKKKRREIKTKDFLIFKPSRLRQKMYLSALEFHSLLILNGPQ